jgi:alcohol dehydrogenase class IV
MFMMNSHKPQVHLGLGALSELEAELRTRQAKRILLVVDKTAYQASGAAAMMEPLLVSYAVERFTGFAMNPKLEDVERGIAQFRRFQPDLMLSLGGGTAIDLGKLIAMLAPQSDSPRDLIRGTASMIAVSTPHVTIPTTAGTGSEATHFAVVYIAGEKYSLAHPTMLPVCTIVDPMLTYSLPRSITVATGLDAFCQAVESLWAVGSTDESMLDARAALSEALEHLVPAATQRTPEARLGMCRAAHFAGRAINVSKTTAPHALSYRLTSKHGIPHGIAVALTLSPLLAYNARVTATDCQDSRGVEQVRGRIALILEVLGAADVSTACAKIEKLLDELGVPSSLAAAGITDEAELRELVASVNAERMSNNPRRLNPAALLVLLQASPAAAAVTRPPFFTTHSEKQLNHV